MLSIFTELLHFLSGPSAVINRLFGMFELVELSGVGKRYIRNIYFIRCYVILCYTMLYYIDIRYLALWSWEKIR